MKNYFKKFSIIFVMLLAVIGVGMIQNGSVVNAATIGQQLTQPETGWKRYDDNDSNITYKGSWVYDKGNTTADMYYNGTRHYSISLGDKYTFYTNSKNIRIISDIYKNRCQSIKVTIDGVSEAYSAYSSSTIDPPCLVYEKLNLSNNSHKVEVQSQDGNSFILDAIDIDSTAMIKNDIIIPSGISLNKTAESLTVNETDNLLATITPTGSNVSWSSSDQSIATVDSTGKVAGIKEGQATITATTDNGLTATCTVNITKKAEQESISLNKSTTNLIAGDSETLVATTTPSAINVTWNSSDTSVATVDSTGKVTAIGSGTTIITGTTADGLTSTCVVNVANKTVPVEPTPTENEYIVNTAHAKGDNTNNASGGVSIIYKGVAEVQLSLVKTADVQSVFVGDNFTYTLVVTNTSSQIAKAVVINDNAPNHIQFTVSGVTTTQGKVDPSSTSKNIIVSVGDIPPLGTVTIKIPATVII